ALHHVDVVARGAARAVVAARACLDRDRLRRANRFAKLTGNATFFPVGITPQRMLAAETRRQHPLLEGIIQRRLGAEEIAHGEEETRDELGEEQRARLQVQSHGFLTLAPAQRTAARWPPPPTSPRRWAGIPSNRAASAGRSDNAAPSPWPWRRERT